MAAATTAASPTSSISEEAEGDDSEPVSVRTPPATVAAEAASVADDDDDEDNVSLSPDEVRTTTSVHPSPSSAASDDASAVDEPSPDGPAAAQATGAGSHRRSYPRLHTVVRRAPRHALQVLFYGATYAPFCASLLLNVAVLDVVAVFTAGPHHRSSRGRGRSRPVDPSRWDVTSKANRPYWIGGVAWFLGLAAYSASTVVWVDGAAANRPYDDADGVGVGGGVPLGPYIWPVLGSTVAFHLLTVRYVLLRPELCRLLVDGGDDRNGSRRRHHRPLRLSNPRNWLGIIFAFVEFAQLVAVPFGGLVPWLPGNDGGGGSRSVYASSSSSTVVETVQGILRTFLVVSNDETVNLIYSTVVVVLFAVMVGEFIASRRCTDDRWGPVLYDVLPGGLFLTTVASMLRVGRATALPSRRVGVLMGMLLYTTPAVFVSVYRGDRNGPSDRSSPPSASCDVAYAPLLLCRERVVKEIFAVVVVYVLSPDEAVGLLAAAMLLGLAMLWVLRRPELFSCPPLVDLRRTFLSVGIWSSACGLIVVRGHGFAGRALLGCGLICILFYSLWRMCCRRVKYGDEQELEQAAGGGSSRRHEEEESKAERQWSTSTVSAVVSSSERDYLAVPFYMSS